MNKEEQQIFKRITELANLCNNRQIPVYTDFLNLNEQDIYISTLKDIPPVSHMAMGGYNLAERKIVEFKPYSDFPSFCPIVTLKIEPKKSKFSDKLIHRDYLGAVLNLGINRNKTGDIIVTEDCAYLFCMDSISEFIMDNLTKIKNTSITVSQTTDIPEDYEPAFKEIKGTVSSLRLDSIIAMATQSSRTSNVRMIEEGLVFVNGKRITSNSFNLKENDLVSVRGIGKFRFKKAVTETKKGRILIIIDRFI